MSGAKHTPGPWEVEPPDEESPNRFTIVTSTAPHWLIAETVPYILGDPDEANARLIAAAPEMLAALEEIAASHVPDQPLTQDVDDYTWALQHVARLRRVAQAALAKARGA